MTGDQNTKMTEVQEKPQEKKNLTKKPPQEKFPCGICNTPYSKSYLKVHIKIHEKKIKDEIKILENEEIGTSKEPSTIKETSAKNDREHVEEVTEEDTDKSNSFQVEAQVINEAKKDESEELKELNTDDERDEEKIIEIEMREHLEDYELAEEAAKVSQELKETHNQKKALGPDAEFLLSTQTGLLVQEMFESIDIDNLLDESKATDNLLDESKDTNNLLDESNDIDILLKERNDIDERDNYLANIIGDVLRETANRVEEGEDAEYHNFGRNADMTRKCCHCDEKFGWLIDLISHMMREHEPFKKMEGISDPMPYLIGELMSELGEEMEGMRYRTEKYQKDITKQLNFQTQTLKQDLLREIGKMVKLDSEPKVEKHHENKTQSEPDTKRLVACYRCEKDVGENTKHFHCLDCGKFFETGKVLNRHIQNSHTEEIKTICDKQECHISKKQMEITIKSLKETIHENAKVIQDALDENETLKEQNIILQNMQTENEFNQTDDKQADTNNDGSVKVQLMCKNCDFLTIEPHILKDHIIKKHRMPNLVCSKCLEEFTSQQLLKIHMNREHKNVQDPLIGHPDKAKQKNQQEGIGNFVCPECPEKFQIKKNWRKHILDHHTVDEFECVECENVFDTKGKYDEHMKRYHGEFQKETKVCRYYKQGRCTNQQCRFAHPENLQPNNQHNSQQKQMPFQPMQQQQIYHQQELEQQQQQNWLPSCRRGPACVFLAQGRCFYFHRKQEQKQQQQGSSRREQQPRHTIACKWMEDCRRVPYCPFQHYAGGDFPPLQQNQHQM